MPNKEIPEEKGNVMFHQTIPNSHYWVDIDMLIRFLNYQIRTQNTPDIIDYLIIGLENCKKNGYSLSKGEPSPERVELQIQKQFSEKGNQLASIVGIIPDLPSPEQDAEIERLKELIKKLWYHYVSKIYSHHYNVEKIDIWWQKFKTENNL
jgi:hypothetical protein